MTDQPGPSHDVMGRMVNTFDGNGMQFLPYEPSAQADEVEEWLDRLADDGITVRQLAEVAGLRNDYCCPLGCGNGACEGCPCCAAGWCVAGADGLPEDPDDRARWIEVAAEHNPIVAALRDATARLAAPSAQPDEVPDLMSNLRKSIERATAASLSQQRRRAEQDGECAVDEQRVCTTHGRFHKLCWPDWTPDQSGPAQPVRDTEEGA